MKKIYALCALSTLLVDSVSATWWSKVEVKKERPWWQNLKVDPKAAIEAQKQSKPLDISLTASKSLEANAKTEAKKTDADAEKSTMTKPHEKNEAFRPWPHLWVVENDTAASEKKSQQHQSSTKASVPKDATPLNFKPLSRHRNRAPENQKVVDSIKTEDNKATAPQPRTHTTFTKGLSRRSLNVETSNPSIVEICPELEIIETSTKTLQRGRRNNDQCNKLKNETPKSLVAMVKNLFE